MPRVTKYGAVWPEDNPLEIERACIRKGGKWNDKSGKECGRGLFHHYREMQTILWPDDDIHRWSDLALKEILENKLVGFLGPGNSNKTYTAAKYALCDYWCFPDKTLFLVSSTDVRGLELRVWGAIKDLINRARERYPDLPGVVLESMHALATDNIEDDDTKARVLNRGLICFPLGTLIDTPFGRKPIERIKSGDFVINAIGIGTVKSSQSSIASELVRVELSDGKEIDCTPEHPFFTRRGWVNAIDLKCYDVVFSAHETMRLLRSGIKESTSERPLLFRPMSEPITAPSMCSMQGVVHAKENARYEIAYRKILQRDMCREVGGTTSEMRSSRNKKMRNVRPTHGRCSSKPMFLFCVLPRQTSGISLSGMRSTLHFDSAVSNEIADAVLRHILQMEMEQSKEWWEPLEGDLCGKEVSETLAIGICALQDNDRAKECKERPAFLRGGFGNSVSESSYRDRWRRSQYTLKADKGCTENSGVASTWVESVKILKRAGDPRYSIRDKGYPVHNLEVSGHPSYSVNGVIVHNCIPCLQGGRYVGLGKYIGLKQGRLRLIADECQLMGSSFLDAISNLLGNPDFKAVLLGNPIDPLDPLGRACEPQQGWSAMPEPTKTTVWTTRFLNGKCVNFVGTDSPNFDDPAQPNRYPYLIGPRKLDEVAAFWGKDSLQYYSQCVGVMKQGMLAHRVITKDLCTQHKAFEKAIWKGTERVWIYAIDAAYSGEGGDRCVAGWIEFGLDPSGKQILCVHPPKIIPITLKSDLIAEDQIAQYVKKDLDAQNIAVSNCFYDSTGRGTLGSAFARVFGANTPVPVEFGGKATTRPVRHDLFVRDKLGNKRLKRCDEHYAKFVTELWFSSRYVIECEQMRELPEDVMMEGCMREYGMAQGNRFEVESKVDTKDRMGRSPDLYDWLVTAIEGARQRGFRIEKLGADVITEDDQTWLEDWQSKQRKLEHSKRLVAT